MNDTERSPAPDWERWQDELARKPVLRQLAQGEWAAMLEGAEPPTDDDVPFTFPVKVPLQNDR